MRLLIQRLSSFTYEEVEVDGENNYVFNVEEKYYTIVSICTHEGGPLADDMLEGYEIECP